jgi:hypothetical protein
MKKIIILLSAITSTTLFGKEFVGNGQRLAQQSTLGQKVLANCAAPKASKELWVNNVRTIIYSGGDMWWDLFGNTNAYYYVPATTNRNTGVSSSFAGSIWLGGLDVGGQLKVAAMTYRQNGIDFWPGPLDVNTASADPDECAKYDNLFEINRAEVDAFVASGFNTSLATPNINSWPGNGNTSLNQDIFLAPFHDANNDNLYDPAAGDYPDYDVYNKALKDNLGFCEAKLYGDNTLFWVFNDKGGPHTETTGVPIGVEVRAQAFAFKTNDEINNMTFYSYEVHNRSSFQLNQTYFTIWNDADLGYYLDDYVGCDVKRGLGYIYNADPFDETASGVNGYQDFPPALGCDFFRGPLADAGDGIDNDQDAGTGNPNSGTDEPGETIQMSRFTYYNNNIGAFPPQTTNPDIAIHYYNFMTGFWKDGSPFTQGGNAYGGTSPAVFVYDGDPVAGTGWTEKAAGNLPGDRRFLQSAGPFTLKPGNVNTITFGMPWAQSPTKGGNIQSLELLKVADDKAQALFDNCFKLLDGPEAPDMTIQEMNNELIFYLTNKKGISNNYKYFNNDYAEQDISIPSDPTSTVAAIKNPDRFYRFEGYKVYQVKDDKVTSSDLTDDTKAKLVFQSDVQNGVGRIINQELDNSLGDFVPKEKVFGEDKGIRSTFVITEDAFSTSSNRKLVNNKTYYFLAVAYAYNNYLTYVRDVPVSVNESANSFGQKRPYLEGRKNKRAAGIPHIPDPEKDGTVAQSAYGFGPKITRIEGQGNGGNMLTLTQASEMDIVNNFTVANLTYENGQGPLSIKVVDPLNVVDSRFTFKFINSTKTLTIPSSTLNALPSAAANSTNGLTGNGGNTAMLNVDNTSWELTDLNSGKKYYPNDLSVQNGTADVTYQTIKVGNEFYFPDLGFSINLKQVADPGEFVNSFTNFTALTDQDNYTGPAAGSFIGASQVYANGTSGWLSALVDVDGTNPDNWIHSGNTKTSGGQNDITSTDDAFYLKAGNPVAVQAFYDPYKQFGKILNGTWAPYPLCASYYTLNASNNNAFPARVFGGPGLNSQVWYNDYQTGNKDYYNGTIGNTTPDRGNTDLRKMSSSLIVYTKDKSKWTRCVVLEMQEKANLSEGNAVFFSPRKHLSVDKQGVALGSPGCNTTEASLTSTVGMGWFPGYAINIETGERLNMAFGEDSYQKENNGDDMVWNPTANKHYPYNTIFGTNGYALGGKHFVYVFGGNNVNSTFKSPGSYNWSAELDGTPYGVGSYDYGARMYNMLKVFFSYLSTTTGGGEYAPINAVERDIMWVSIPMVKAGFEFKDPANMPSDVRTQINVAKPYRYGYAGVGVFSSQSIASSNKLSSVTSNTMLTPYVSSSPQNNNFPMYNFNTSDIATLIKQASTSKNALDLIRVVPNPYYGSSSYEANRIDNRVRITNLPSKCSIKIFTMNGTLVRTIKRDVTGQEDVYIGDTGAGTNIKQSKRLSYQDWDLKNQDNISVASGLYIFYIDAPGIGEKIIKWFGVMRPLDVQSY